MAEGDTDYYTRRAQQEREMAGKCADSSSAMAHRQLAEEYERRAARVPLSQPPVL